jgi:hypothetical protein
LEQILTGPVPETAACKLSPEQKEHADPIARELSLYCFEGERYAGEEAKRKNMIKQLLIHP